MKFKEWYEFNKQITGFTSWPVFVKLFRKHSLLQKDVALTDKMNLKDINFFFGDYEVNFIDNYNDRQNDIGLMIGLYNPEKELDNKEEM